MIGRLLVKIAADDLVEAIMDDAPPSLHPIKQDRAFADAMHRAGHSEYSALREETFQ